MTAPLDAELGALAEDLRRVTVRLQIGGAGEGSGVIWRPDGLIVTNAHVARARSATVRLEGGETLEGRVIAREPALDLAALFTGARGLPAARLGDTGRLRPGDLVVALGHPLGVPNAVSLGVVHELVRETDGRLRWIAADLRLAPGNSGGPLAAVDGRIVGINTLVAAGLGFAVPVSLVNGFLRRAGIAPDERAA
jgi:serine protease Do